MSLTKRQPPFIVAWKFVTNKNEHECHLMSFCPVNTKALRKLCVFQFATNDENEFGDVFTK